MTIRVLLLTQWFDPEPTPKGLAFAQELAEQGFAVEVLTGFPNYPGGKLYPGYRVKLLQRETIGKVAVTRIPLYPDHGQSAVRRALNYVSFACSVLVYGLFFAKRPNVIYAYHPPLTVGIAAALIRIVRRVPVVYDIQDMWPDTLRATGMISSSRMLGLIAKICRWVYRHVDHLVVLSHGFKRLLLQRGVSEQKIDVIYNWCNEAAIAKPSTAAPASLERFADRFRVVFAGNMGKAQALESVLQAAVLLREQAPQVCFIFLGGGIEVGRLQETAQRAGLDNVMFLPQVPMEEVGSVLNLADVLLVHLRKDPLFEITIPSKTQAYLAAGKPILMAVSGEAAALIRQSGGGVIAEPENSEAIAAAILSLYRATSSARAEMAAAGAEFYREHLSLRVGVTKFAALLRRLAVP